MTKDEILTKVLGTKQHYQIPRPVLLDKIARLAKRNGELHLELFCENPDHSFFSNVPEIDLAPLRLEKVRRCEVRAERFNPPKTVCCNKSTKRLCVKACGHDLPHKHSIACENKSDRKCGKCVEQ